MKLTLVFALTIIGYQVSFHCCCLNSDVECSENLTVSVFIHRALDNQVRKINHLIFVNWTHPCLVINNKWYYTLNKRNTNYEFQVVSLFFLFSVVCSSCVSSQRWKSNICCLGPQYSCQSMVKIYKPVDP